MNSIINNLGSLTRELLSTEIRREQETAQEVCSEAGVPTTEAGLLVAAWLKAYTNTLAIHNGRGRIDETVVIIQRLQI